MEKEEDVKGGLSSCTGRRHVAVVNTGRKDFPQFGSVDGYKRSICSKRFNRFTQTDM